MKKMISVIALAAISTSASAFDYKFNLEGRSDFVHENTKTTSAAGTEASGQSNGFLSSLIRLNLAGAINDNLSYRMRYRFNQEGTNTPRDSSSNSLDYLYVDHKNSLFTTRFGKMNWAESYGRESFISSTDLFLNSAAYSAYNSNIGNYRFGVAATYTFLETHKLTLAISNPNATASDTGTATPLNTSSSPSVTNASNHSLAYGIHYSSLVFSKAFQPLLSYTVANQDGDAQASTQKAKYQMMAAGFRAVAIENLIFDVDWKQFKRAATTAAGTADKTTSIFANVAYSVNDWSPFVQYVHDQFSDERAINTTEYKQNSFAAGVMWKPYNDVNFRYHLVYTNLNRKYDDVGATFKKIQDNRITFGIKADI